MVMEVMTAMPPVNKYSGWLSIATGSRSDELAASYCAAPGLHAATFSPHGIRVGVGLTPTTTAIRITAIAHEDRSKRASLRVPLTAPADQIARGAERMVYRVVRAVSKALQAEAKAERVR